MAAQKKREEEWGPQAPQMTAAPNTYLLSNMPNQTNALAVAAVQQQAIAAMNTLVTSNTAADDGGGNLDDGNDINPSDGSPGMEIEEDEDLLENDDDDDDAFPAMDDEAEDPPHGAAIVTNQLLDDATVLANATATANARTATTRTIVDHHMVVTNVTLLVFENVFISAAPPDSHTFPHAAD
jgi:hypothetical protein